MFNSDNSVFRKAAIFALHSIFVFTSLSVTAANQLPILSLEMAVKAAQQNDPWMAGNRHAQDSMLSMSIAAATLPDPRMTLGLANIAAESFDFRQEGMSQFQIGLSQMFPRGDSLELKQKQLQQLSAQFPYQRQDRLAKIEVIVSQLWFDAYKAQESIKLIENNRALFEQLADVAQASYSSAVGKTRQQDIIRAQLELTRIDDRLTMLQQNKDMALQKLAQWQSDYFLQKSSKVQDYAFRLNNNFLLSEALPEIKAISPELYLTESNLNQSELFRYFLDHPAIKAVEQQIKASDSEIEIAKQSYKAEWGLSAGYAFRDDDPLGNKRANLFSVGISFDIPLFTANRQDQQVKSAVSKTASVKTEKWLLLRNLISAFESEKVQWLKLSERQDLYQNRLLPQMHDQAEASLTAYTNDDGDFSEVVRARIAELNALIDALNINVDRQKTLVQLNYYLLKAAHEKERHNNSDFNQVSGE